MAEDRPDRPFAVNIQEMQRAFFVQAGVRRIWILQGFVSEMSFLRDDNLGQLEPPCTSRFQGQVENVYVLPPILTQACSRKLRRVVSGGAFLRNGRRTEKPLSNNVSASLENWARQKATVENQSLAGHERSAIRTHPYHGFRDFRRSSKTPDADVN